MSIKLDLHVHSESRGKVFITAEQLRNSLKRNSLNGVAITNFFSLAHALWLKQKVKEYIVIVGQEILTKEGHIVGLGLKKRIIDYQSAQETINHIHRQGGIAVAIHPFLPLGGVGSKAISLSIDAIEVYNGSIGIFFIPNYLAKRTAQGLQVGQL
jgi:predicted metal-dependent phosphoesterase TrpH